MLVKVKLLIWVIFSVFNIYIYTHQMQCVKKRKEKKWVHPSLQTQYSHHPTRLTDALWRGRTIMGAGVPQTCATAHIEISIPLPPNLPPIACTSSRARANMGNGQLKRQVFSRTSCILFFHSFFVQQSTAHTIFQEPLFSFIFQRF